MATASDEATAASIRATAASIRPTAASVSIETPPDVHTIAEPYYARYEVPIMGLLCSDHGMRGGNIGRPMVLNGEEIGGVTDIEVILRGGRLDRPLILTGLQTANNNK